MAYPTQALQLPTVHEVIAMANQITCERIWLFAVAPTTAGNFLSCKTFKFDKAHTVTGKLIAANFINKKVKLC